MGHIAKTIMYDFRWGFVEILLGFYSFNLLPVNLPIFPYVLPYTCVTLVYLFIYFFVGFPRSSSSFTIHTESGSACVCMQANCVTGQWWASAPFFETNIMSEREWETQQLCSFPSLPFISLCQHATNTSIFNTHRIQFTTPMRDI